MRAFLLIIFIFNLNIFVSESLVEIDFVQRTACSQGSSSASAQYFNTANLKCELCTSDVSAINSLQQSADGLSCACKPNYRLQSSYGGNKVVCVACNSNEIVSSDGWSCIECPSGTCDACPATQIKVDRQIDGTPNNPYTCQACVGTTQPNSLKTRCERCSKTLSLLPSSPTPTTCDCTGTVGTFTGGICIPSPAPITTSVDLESVQSLETITTNHPSYFMKENAIAAYEMCERYENITACQILGNMCVLRMYARNSQTDACSRFRSISSVRPKLQSFTDWAVNMPWLYYGDGTSTDTILTSDKITYNYKRTDTLQLRLASYNRNGTYNGIFSAEDGRLQMCKDTRLKLNAAYKYGTHYSQECTISGEEMFNKATFPLEFFDIYLQFTASDGSNKLFPVPVKIMNLIGTSSDKPNEDTDQANWQLTRRFFLVDNVATSATSDGEPVVVRYASDIEIQITPKTLSEQTTQTQGRINPPLVSITYKELAQKEDNVTIKFTVTYVADQTRFQYELSVAMGTMCALGALFAILRAWSYSRRSGLETMDIVMVVKIIVFASAAIANVFFIVIFGISFYYLIFYKNQVEFSIYVPTVTQEEFLVIYISIAVGLKCIEVIHLLIVQGTIDIFFIDWEKSQNNNQDESLAPAIKTTEDIDKAEKGMTNQAHAGPVRDTCPIWRTYFAANEWNEIQTYRKTTPLVTLFVVLFFMEVVGFKNYASMDSTASINRPSEEYFSGESRLFRFAIIAVIHIIIGILQWAFHILIYERYFDDKLRGYTDLLSLLNISAFIMSHKQFGYYIHGKTIHGKSEVGLRQMTKNLDDEHTSTNPRNRGLKSNNDIQSFMMALPTAMRKKFDQLYAPFAEGHDQQNALDTYVQLNSFLKKFIEGAKPDYNDMDYEIVEHRRFLEDVLDLEFDQSAIIGHFYADDGNSFGDVLYYNNELTLFTFDLLVFLIVDIILQNTVLDAVVTWLLQIIVAKIRDGTSENNLAKKTLIDKRFLI